MDDGTGLAEALLGLAGFRVLTVVEDVLEVVIDVETIADFVGCGACGRRAEAQDRMAVDIRDLACFGRPARLVWRKRRWRCVDADCDAKTWTETSPSVSARTVLTRRAGIEACRQVGMNARPVAGLARELGVSWSTVMDAVEEHGRPLVEDPERVGPVTTLGVDETSFLAANPRHSTIYVTGLVDLTAHKMIDMVEGNRAVDLRRWCAEQDPAWLAAITTVATDLAESYAPASTRTSRTRRGSPIRSTWCGSRTDASTGSAAASRTTPSATAAAARTRSTRSASCCSPAGNASTTGAATACCWACGSETLTTSSSAGGWQRSRSATSTSPTIPKKRRC